MKTLPSRIRRRKKCNRNVNQYPKPEKQMRYFIYIHKLNYYLEQTSEYYYSKDITLSEIQSATQWFQKVIVLWLPQKFIG